ncbi:hypothetical protein VIGAN_10113800 [Vigna angularis var. angularis]|uniref:PPC domain-containing protein n=1 Tax=Vigna angularis var. angularis TaxID=157739 RepID=A0A0S3T3A7_PHAAN|nr:hypothetical protein VIGAN_10113800 [Vigna angularis var. angularis]
MPSKRMKVIDGCKIIDIISTFACHRQRGICIMSGIGTMTNVTLREPTSFDTIVMLHSRFEIFFVAGSFLASPATTSLTVYLVVEGSVIGALTTLGPMVIVPASFNNVAFERLLLEDLKVMTND